MLWCDNMHGVTLIFLYLFQPALWAIMWPILEKGSHALRKIHYVFVECDTADIYKPAHLFKVMVQFGYFLEDFFVLFI